MMHTWLVRRSNALTVVHLILQDIHSKVTRLVAERVDHDVCIECCAFDVAGDSRKGGKAGR